MGIKSNRPAAYYFNVFGKSGNTKSPAALNASGGTTQTYTSGSDTYKSHTFTSPGTFVISGLGVFLLK